MKRRSILLVKPQSDESEDSDEQMEDKNGKESGSENDKKQEIEMDCENSDAERNEQSDDGDSSHEEESLRTTNKKSGSNKIADEKTQKKRKSGIIYISSIPKHMNVTLIREYLAPLGDLGRVFLQPDKKFLTRKKKLHSKKQLAIHFTEGWIEFLSKRKAKFAAQQLNNHPITTKKNSRFCDVLWSMKYLPRFKWVHLSERLTYEKQMYKQKLQVEISQARKEANFFQANLDKSDRVKKINKKKVKEDKKLANKD